MNFSTLIFTLAAIVTHQVASAATPPTPVYHCYMQKNAQQAEPRIEFEIPTTSPGTQTKVLGSFTAKFMRTQEAGSNGFYDLLVELTQNGGATSEMGFDVGIKWFQLSLGKGGANSGDMLLACSTWGQ